VSLQFLQGPLLGREGEVPGAGPGCRVAAPSNATPPTLPGVLELALKDNARAGPQQSLGDFGGCGWGPVDEPPDVASWQMADPRVSAAK